MKKKIAMTVMALAVSAMAGSAFAAENVPAKKIELPATTNMVALTTAEPVISLEQMAKEQGITVEALIAKLEKEGKITKAASIHIFDQDGSTSQTIPMTKIELNDKDGNAVKTVPGVKIDLNKEAGILSDAVKVVPGVKIELNKEAGTLSNAVAMTKIELNDKDGNVVPFTTVIDLEQLAKEQGITVEELIAKLEKEGKITKAVSITPATKN